MLIPNHWSSYLLSRVDINTVSLGSYKPIEISLSINLQMRESTVLLETFIRANRNFTIIVLVLSIRTTEKAPELLIIIYNLLYYLQI